MFWQRCVAAALAVLILATYRLWLVDGEFPRIGRLSASAAWTVSVGRWLIPTISVSILAGCVFLMANRGPRFRRIIWALVSFSLATAFVLDTMTFQPWAYQAFLYAALFAFLDDRAPRYQRIIAVSIYLWSAWSKLDYQFTHSLGREFLSMFTLGFSESLSESAQTKLAVCLPVTEAIIGCLLARAPTRRFGQIGATLLHAGLFVVLGPWSAGHSSGVVLWNLLLIGQTWTLWSAAVDEPTPSPDASRLRPNPILRTLAEGLVAVAVLGPIGERVEWWDHWPAWAVYAPHTGRVQIQVHASAMEQTPRWTHDHWRPPNEEGWQTLSLSDAAIGMRGVPVYPQRRYQRELASLVAAVVKSKRAIRSIEIPPTDRWSGRRETIRIEYGR